MVWLCLRNNTLSGSQMCIVTGPRLDLAIGLIDRIKKLFHVKANIYFATKETVIELNGVRIEAFPSHHLSAMRGLTNVSFILLDESDFFPIGQQQEARDVSERYIGKSNPYIIIVSTPDKPGGLMDTINKDLNSMYTKIYLPYTVGVNTIYSKETVLKVSVSANSQKEYNLTFTYGNSGSLFSSLEVLERAKRIGKLDGKLIEDIRNNPQITYQSLKSVGLDIGYSDSKTALAILGMYSLYDNITNTNQDIIQVFSVILILL
jgi:hypothetical protein